MSTDYTPLSLPPVSKRTVARAIEKDGCGCYEHTNGVGGVTQVWCGKHWSELHIAPVCDLCAAGANVFIDPITGNRIHARNGEVTLCRM